ncbi:MAG: hypothetical protein ABI222_10635 [Opitutaceae bacterium]
MTTRAQALARNLIARVRQFEQARGDQDPQVERDRSELRQQLVEKVLFSEVGLTDYAKARLVAVAMPRVTAGQQVSPRDQSELAEFLETHLDLASLAP